MATEPEGGLSSRQRLLAAGKMLFARLGYEQTSTATIAREAGSSESQLVRYFRGKAGLLEAIFDESWRPLNQRIQTLLVSAPDAREALLGIFSTLINAFGEDHALAFLLMFEGRRVRGAGNAVFLSRGFLSFADVLRRLIVRGQKDGTFAQGLNQAALGAALMGAAEGMIRDRLIAERSGKPNPFSEEEVRRVFAAMLDGLSVGARR